MANLRHIPKLIRKMPDILTDSELEIVRLNTRLRAIDRAGRLVEECADDRDRLLDGYLNAEHATSEDDFEGQRNVGDWHDLQAKAEARLKHAQQKLTWEERNAPGFLK